eukprot:535402_1
MSSDEIVLNKFNALPNNRQELLLTTAAMIENEDDKELCICNAKMMKFTDEDMPFLLKIMVAKLIIRKMNIPNVKHGDMEAMLLAKSYPKNIGMPRELYLDWPRDTVTLEMLKKKVIIAQVVLELCVTKQKKHSVAHNPEILNEYEARIKFKNSILRLANVTKEKAIKASKKMSIDEIVQKIAADIHNNEERYISVRCADIFEAVFLIKAAIREMKQLRRTIQFRMINIIKIAKKDETGSLKPTQKRLLFGVEIKAPAMYTDYSELLDTSLSVQEDLQETLNILNGTKVELISRTFATSQTFGSLCTEVRVLNINPIGKWGKKMNPKTKKIEDWFLYQEITLQSNTIGAADIKYKNNKEKTPSDKNVPILIFKDWIHENSAYLFDNVFHLMAEISPNDPRKVKELVLPKLPKDIDDQITLFQQQYGARKIDWVQYMVHEMHLDMFMKSMRNEKAKNMGDNERKQEELKDCDQIEVEEQKHNEQDINVQEIIDKLNDDNVEAMNDLDRYLARNENLYSYEDVIESEESNIFQQINNCEHSEIESEAESEPTYEKNQFEIDESDSDEYEKRSLEKGN